MLNRVFDCWSVYTTKTDYFANNEEFFDTLNDAMTASTKHGDAGKMCAIRHYRMGGGSEPITVLDVIDVHPDNKFRVCIYKGEDMRRTDMAGWRPISELPALFEKKEG